MSRHSAHRVRLLANRTSTAYAFGLYGLNVWEGCIEYLIGEGCSDESIEAIMFSKWPRHAAEGDDDGHGTVAAFRAFYEQNKAGVPVLAAEHRGETALAKALEDAGDMERIGSLAANAGVLRGHVASLLSLVRLKYGNLDPDVNAYIATVEAILEETK